MNKINTMRREAGFAVSDRIHVIMETTEPVQNSFKEHHEFICSEVLAVDVRFGACLGTVWNLNEEIAKIELTKV